MRAMQAAGTSFEATIAVIRRVGTRREVPAAVTTRRDGRPTSVGVGRNETGTSGCFLDYVLTGHGNTFLPLHPWPQRELGEHAHELMRRQSQVSAI